MVKDFTTICLCLHSPIVQKHWKEGGDTLNGAWSRLRMLRKGEGVNPKGLVQVQGNTSLIGIYEEASQSLKLRENNVPKETMKLLTNLVADRTPKMKCSLVSTS